MDPSKKSVQWGSVKTGVLTSGSGGLALRFGPPELLGEGVHFAMKSARIWLFDCMAGLEVQLELSQLCCPLGDVARGIGVV